MSVTLNLQPVNDAPVAISKSYETTVETGLDLVLAANDVEGDDLIYTLLSLPKSGSLSGEAPDLRYTPSEDFVGLDAFEFQVSDGDLVSAPTVATLVVAETPNRLRALPAVYVLQEDEEVSFTLTSSSDINDPTIFQLRTRVRN